MRAEHCLKSRGWSPKHTAAFQILNQSVQEGVSLGQTQYAGIAQAVTGLQQPHDWLLCLHTACSILHRNKGALGVLHAHAEADVMPCRTTP